MDVVELSVPGAWSFTPKQWPDPRGVFLEWFKDGPFADAVGHRLDLKQANISVSSKGTVRGVHFADVPPGQAKYVTCARGAVLDVVVDLRVGSPTFGRWDSVRLDDQEHAAVYIAEGLGHAFVALTDHATVMYLCSTVYTPSAEHGLNPLDPALAIDWPKDLRLVVSEKDSAAPTLAEARAAGALPRYAECREFYASLGSEPARSE